MPTGEDRESPSSKALASRLAKYAYASSGPSPRRAVAAASTRSAQVSPTGSRLPTGQAEGVLQDEAAEVDFDPSRSVAGPSRWQDISVAPSGKRKTPTKEASSPGSKKAKKVPRPYAGPEVYAHLKNTPDHLGVGLDIIFCGINFICITTCGCKKSAATGTHFAHPTNKFWRALHQSGLTPRLYAPNECHLLPAELNYGLTNLCGRPTAEQSELSTLEMRLNVHPFAAKLVRLRPRVVCFVGKKIWDVFEAVAGKTAKSAEPRRGASSGRPVGVNKRGSVDGYTEVKQEEGDGDLVKREPASSASSPLTDIDRDADSRDDIKPIIPQTPSAGPSTPIRAKMEPSQPASTPRRKAATTTAFDWYAPRSLRLPLPPIHGEEEVSYCYFWVTPSTSGLERTPLAEQVNIFAAMRAFSESLRVDGDPALDGFRDIDMAGLQGTAEKILAEAVAKGATVYPSVHAT